MSTVKTTDNRLPFIDIIKVIASQLIVLHHLAFYGPMSDYAKTISPELFSWFAQYARIAVQAFLVTGGFLAAQSLARDGIVTGKPLFHLLWRRYLKLAAPFFFALLLVVAASAVARHLMAHGSISATPTFAQFFAHVFLLQGILGFDGLLAGAWYVAIDFQLYALLLVVLRLAHGACPKLPAAGRWCVLALVAVSLFYFNRSAAWDNWAVYFIAAYGLGAITYWSTRTPHGKKWIAAIIALTIGALWLDYRVRILATLLIVCSLALERFANLEGRWPRQKPIEWLGKISYSVFLTHFSTCLVINGIFERFAPHTPIVQLAGIGIAWIASNLVGAVFYHAIENPAQKWLGQVSITKMRIKLHRKNSDGLSISR